MPPYAVDYYTRMIDALEEIYLRPFCEQVCSSFPGPVRILDLGTGTGQLPILLARANSLCHVAGVDLSEPCLAVGRARAAKARVADRVQFVRANVQRNELEPAAFDLALSVCSLHHWRHPVQLLRGLARAVKDSGSIWIWDHTRQGSENGWRDWIRQVERVAHPGILFRTVFRFETKFLSYSREEVEALCGKAGLAAREREFRGPFFLARMSRDVPATPEASAQSS